MGMGGEVDRKKCKKMWVKKNVGKKIGGQNLGSGARGGGDVQKLGVQQNGGGWGLMMSYFRWNNLNLKDIPLFSFVMTNKHTDRQTDRQNQLL